MEQPARGRVPAPLELSKKILDKVCDKVLFLRQPLSTWSLFFFLVSLVCLAGNLLVSLATDHADDFNGKNFEAMRYLCTPCRDGGHRGQLVLAWGRNSLRAIQRRRAQGCLKANP